MRVVRLQSEHQQKYSEFVATHPSGSFLQSWSWGEFQTSIGKSVVRYGVFSEDTSAKTSTEHLLATIQLLIVKVPHLPGVYLYSPYGPLITEPNPANDFQTTEPSQIISALISQIKKDFAKAWFIRFEPKDDFPLEGKLTIHIQPRSTLITDISISEDALLKNMHHKTRYNIKVASKHNVVVRYIEKSPREAIALLGKTSKRQRYKSHPDSYYFNLISYFASENKLGEKKNSDCKITTYEALYDNKCIASAIMIDHGTTRTYLFGGSEDINKNLMAPYALHWQAICDAKTLGLTRYDWWGTETATGKSAGFVQFKKRWGGIEKFYPEAKDMIIDSKWYFLYNVFRKINRLM